MNFIPTSKNCAYLLIITVATFVSGCYKGNDANKASTSPLSYPTKANDNRIPPVTPSPAIKPKH